MALQSSGAISFANLQTEFGGSHPITMGEYSAYRVSGSGNTISMNQFYGAAGTLDTQTVAVGSVTWNTLAYIGRINNGVGVDIGSISDGSWNVKDPEATILALYKLTNYHTFALTIDGTYTNSSDWTTMTVNGNDYARTSATHTTGNGQTNWYWYSVTINPFGATSGDVDVTWT